MIDTERDLDVQRARERALLVALLKPFDARLVRTTEAGDDYVSHTIVEQRLFAVVGPFGWEITKTVRDHKSGELSGCVGRLTVMFAGRVVATDGTGVVHDSKGELRSDAARLKWADSDALKRAAMRLGVGLNLWARGSTFYAYEMFLRAAGVDPDGGAAPDDESVAVDDAKAWLTALGVHDDGGYDDSEPRPADVGAGDDPARRTAGSEPAPADQGTAA